MRVRVSAGSGVLIALLALAACGQGQRLVFDDSSGDGRATDAAPAPLIGRSPTNSALSAAGPFTSDGNGELHKRTYREDLSVWPYGGALALPTDYFKDRQEWIYITTYSDERANKVETHRLYFFYVPSSTSPEKANRWQMIDAGLVAVEVTPYPFDVVPRKSFQNPRAISIRGTTADFVETGPQFSARDKERKQGTGSSNVVSYEVEWQTSGDCYRYLYQATVSPHFFSEQQLIEAIEALVPVYPDEKVVCIR